MINMFCLLIISCFFFACTHGILGQVLELDDSFNEKRGDHAYLVKFYAPWCGHCRKLEPTFHQVYLELKNTKIIVAKVDATRFSRLASEYEVHGYPTIKFIQGDRVFTHNGERSKEGIVEFAKRAYGPQIRQLASVGRLSEAKTEHSSSAFFLYVGPMADDSKLYTLYSSIALRYAVLSYFYAGLQTVLTPDVTISNYPSVLVFKDGTYAEFIAPEEPDKLDEALDTWINKERFLAFPKIAGVGLNEMSTIGKMLTIFVIDDKDMSSAKQSRYREIGQLLATNVQYADYKSHYQLVWMTDVEVAGNIIMSSIDSPFLFVLNPQTHQYYIPDFTEHQELTVANVTDFLDSVSNGTSPVYGGTGLGQRFRRLFYDIRSTVYGIYRESIWLALMVFGIPTLVIGIICYTLCCLEPADDDELNAGSDEDNESCDQFDGELAEGPVHEGEQVSDHVKSD